MTLVSPCYPALPNLQNLHLQFDSGRRLHTFLGLVHRSVQHLVSNDEERDQQDRHAEEHKAGYVAASACGGIVVRHRWQPTSVRRARLDAPALGPNIPLSPSIETARLRERRYGRAKNWPAPQRDRSQGRRTPCAFGAEAAQHADIGRAQNRGPKVCHEAAGPAPQGRGKTARGFEPGLVAL